jgi:hypothetical protein
MCQCKNQNLRVEAISRIPANCDVRIRTFASYSLSRVDKEPERVGIFHISKIPHPKNR